MYNNIDPTQEAAHLGEANRPKKIKTMKTPEGALLDSGEPVRDVTKDALEELMTKQTIMLGALKS